jgi:hypothetical protein
MLAMAQVSRSIDYSSGAGGDQLAAMPSAVRLASQGYLASSAITPIAPVICARQAGVSLPLTARC